MNVMYYGFLPLSYATCCFSDFKSFHSKSSYNLLEKLSDNPSLWTDYNLLATASKTSMVWKFQTDKLLETPYVIFWNPPRAAHRNFSFLLNKMNINPYYSHHFHRCFFLKKMFFKDVRYIHEKNLFSHLPVRYYGTRSFDPKVPTSLYLNHNNYPLSNIYLQPIQVQEGLTRAAPSSDLPIYRCVKSKESLVKRFSRK